MTNRTLNLRTLLPALALVCLPGTSFALHGTLSGVQRDAWIDGRVDTLVAAGWVKRPAKPTAELTNLEVAQLTKEAVEYRMAQADLLPPDMGAPPPMLPDPILPSGSSTSSNGSFQELVAEFREELSMMDVDLAKLEERLEKARKRAIRFAKLQEEYLKRTGTAVSGYSRAWFDQYRGFGPNRFYNTPMDFHGILLADIELKSVPVPYVLFDTKLRITRSIGMYYADPITPNFDLRWLALSNKNGAFDLTVGDFFRSYTPLTLWNYEVPVHTFVEPSSYKRLRRNAEEMVFMDHGPDWRLRGIDLAADHALEKDSFVSSFHLQAMGGELRDAIPLGFDQLYAGTQVSLGLLEEVLDLKAAGLLLWDEPTSSNIPTMLGVSSTYAKRYEMGSLSANLDSTLAEGIKVQGSFEYAGSQYTDNTRAVVVPPADPVTVRGILQDWAILAEGAVEVEGLRLGMKYRDVGPYFYSPGAQTNRYSPGSAPPYPAGYLDNNLLRDYQLIGYRNNFVFQDVDRPTFAPFDRMVENVFPYGDATPNRKGIILSLGGGIGKEGWIKPRGSYILQMEEWQPNYVLVTSGDAVLPADSQDSSANARSFGGWEAALTLDLSKVLEGSPSTLSIAGDFKHQTTDLGWNPLAPAPAPEPFMVDTLIVTADAGPFPQVPLLEGIVLTAAFLQAQSQGSEYFLMGPGKGTPPTLGQYHSYIDTGVLLPGTYGLQEMTITRTSMAVGFKVPMGRALELRGDWIINKYTWAEMPAFDRREQIWVLGYELSF